MRFFTVLFLVISLVGCSNVVDGQASALAPDFSLELISGEKVILSEILKEKNAVLFFWTTWCPYCRREMVQADEFYKKNKDRVAVLGINIGETKNKTENFIRQLGVSYPVALDRGNTVSGLYKVRGVPTIVAVDKKGRVVYSGHILSEMVDETGF